MGAVASSIGSIGRSVFGANLNLIKNPLGMVSGLAGGLGALGGLGGQRGGGDNGPYDQYKSDMDRQARILADQQKRTAAERDRLQREESDRKRGGRMRGRRSLLNQGDEVGVKLRSTLG